MIPQNSYAANLVQKVDSGLFDATPVGQRLRRLTAGMDWRAAPVEGMIAWEFGGLDRLNAAVEAYRGEALREGRMIPEQGPVCIEDRTSAVILCNHPSIERAVYVVDYQPFIPPVFALVTASLMLEDENPERIGFDVSELYAAFVDGKSIDDRMTELMWGASARDIVQATITGIEQLAYLHVVKPM